MSGEQRRSLCVLLNCFCTLHACTPQTSRCRGARRQGDGFQTRIFRRTVNRVAGRTLLGLLWGASRRKLSVGEMGGELSATQRVLRELWLWFPHSAQPLIHFGVFHPECDADAARYIWIPVYLLRSAPALAHFNPLGVHQGEKVSRCCHFQILSCQVERKDKNVNIKQSDVSIQPAIFLLSVPTGDIVKAAHKQSGRIHCIIDAQLWLWH